ncbi:CU044_5270 family protein [Streptomyces sp. NPDC059862]|uniref:CU044_5270 family protein n=1 Tax=unclassified Streptomyces TaxID=2593676 RepID=UPI00363581F2
MNQLPERDLPPGRHRLLKEHLMTEIRRTEETPARRGLLRPALVFAAVAAIAAVTITVVPSDEDIFVPPAATPSPGVARLLEDAALVAEHQKAPKVRDDQFTYVKSKVAWGISEQTCKPATAGPLQTREVWKSVDGKSEGRVSDTGIGDPLPIEPDAESNRNYRKLENLPTDPDKMLAWLYKNKEGEGRSAADLAFDLAVETVGETVLPPKVSAALYRAVAKIPGVVLVKDSVDAVGRHGTAVGFVNDGSSRQELIFDRKTLILLGSRDVVLKDSPTNPGQVCDGMIKAGSVQGTSAVLERAFVDKVGERP